MIPESLRTIAGLEELPLPIPRSGIYFLVSEGTVCYVGQSKDLVARVMAHWRANPRVWRTVVTFDQVFWLPVPVAELNDVEAYWITTLRPQFNGRHDNGRMYTWASRPCQPKETDCVV